jgi:Putative beta barrel porin-7 (BBP7)
MRFLLAGTVGLALGAGGALAQNPSATWPQPGDSPVSLGRPVPAASLGRPMPAFSTDWQLQQAGFRQDPNASFPRPVESAPLLAPIGSPVADTAPKPLPAESGKSSVAPMPPAVPSTPGSTYGTTAPGCAACGSGYTYGGDPGIMGMPMVGSDFAGYPSRFYASAEFLLWWVPTIRTPLPIALASTQPYDGSTLPPTTVAIGNTDLISNVRIGGKFGGGFWFDPCHTNGIDANFFFIGPAHRDLFTATSAALPTLLRPYVVINEPVTGGTPAPAGRPNFADIVAQNGDTGNVRVHTESFMTGSDINFRHNLCMNCCGSLDLLLGFRYLHLDELLRVTETGAQTNNGVTTTGTLTDSFRTSNNFFGSNIGVIAQRQWGPWSIDFISKFGVGTNMSTVDIAGSVAFVNPTANFNQGLFAQPSNIGHWQNSHFSVVSETGLNLGFNILPRTRLHVGYSILYWSNVLRPGDQMDPIIDQTLVPTPPGTPARFQPLHPSDPHPVVTFKRSDFWAQGLNFGITVRW